MTNDFSKFETKELTKPRDKAWENFAKFERWVIKCRVSYGMSSTDQQKECINNNDDSL